MKKLLLITTPPHAYKHKQALVVATDALAKGETLSVFFYGDGAYVANRLNWQSADVVNITQSWVNLAQRYNLPLPVCVSTALARGVSDAVNATRHGLDGDNLHSAFVLVGLSELAMQMDDATILMQF